MSAATPQPPDDETAAAISYVRGLWPPLPRAYGPWLVELAHRARAGADPELELAVPDAILDSGTLPRPTRRAEDGTLTITLREALTALRQEDLLYPDEEDPTWPPVEIVSPAVALSLANTADAAYAAQAHDPQAVTQLAEALKGGQWEVDLDNPIRVDQQGRITTGLNLLLAIVAACMDAPAAITYAYDDGPLPLTWRAPTDPNPGEGHDQACNPA